MIHPMPEERAWEEVELERHRAREMLDLHEGSGQVPVLDAQEGTGPVRLLDAAERVELLRRARRIAVVGASDRPGRASRSRAGQKPRPPAG